MKGLPEINNQDIIDELKTHGVICTEISIIKKKDAPMSFQQDYLPLKTRLIFLKSRKSGTSATRKSLGKNTSTKKGHRSAIGASYPAMDLDTVTYYQLVLSVVKTT